MSNREKLYKYKGNKCAYCGLSVPEMVERFGTFNRMFEFNHVDPSKKHPDYDNLIQRELSAKQLDEVDKCILMCRECHGIIHAQNIYAELLITVDLGRKRAEQKLKGQVIFDRRERIATFLTSEKILIHPYRVSLGGRKPRIHFGTELDGGALDSYLREIARHKTIVIRSWSKKEVMRVLHIGENRIAVSQDIHFPLSSSELFGEEPHPTTLWIRNGVAMTKGGEIFSGGTLTFQGTIDRPCDQFSSNNSTVTLFPNHFRVAAGILWSSRSKNKCGPPPCDAIPG